MIGKSLLYFAAAALFVQLVSSENLTEKETEWRQELRQAQAGAAQQLQTNLLTVLNGLAESAANRGANVTRAIHTLTQAVVKNTFDLAGVVAYMPRLMLLDLPTQFVEVLQLARRNQLSMPNDVNSAIDTVTALANQAQDSRISENVFGPIIRFLPNMLNGMQTFLQTIIGNVFGFLGVTGV
ncbi:unnamed protein product [Allacma fusca]|uniref:Uncharacterized protein n=1 Tax=Allacma fusca TaxID=39272 RepID=A0A8J2KZ31_9HEXA|nr:unnamed protein product [Allacma fusca]